MRWIIENFTGDNGYEDLIAEVRKQGYDCDVLDITNHFDLKVNPKDECVVFQGSIQLAAKLKAELDTCYPVAWNTMDNYLCTKYYPKLGKYLFNDTYVMIPACELERQKWDFYRWLGKEAMLFVRPDCGDKSFKGGLIDLQDFDKEWERNYNYGMSRDEIVIVSSPKNMLGEWRFICTDEKEIIACSSYMFHGQRTYVPSAPQGATDLVKEILEVGYYPDRVFTVDIVMDNDENFWLMELNSFSSAGTYGCKKEPIVRRVSEIAQDDWNSRLDSNKKID